MNNPENIDEMPELIRANLERIKAKRTTSIPLDDGDLCFLFSLIERLMPDRMQVQ